jgi:hypothetical protein
VRGRPTVGVEELGRREGTERVRDPSRNMRLSFLAAEDERLVGMAAT